MDDKLRRRRPRRWSQATVMHALGVVTHEKHDSSKACCEAVAAGLGRRL